MPCLYCNLEIAKKIPGQKYHKSCYHEMRRLNGFDVKVPKLKSIKCVFCGKVFKTHRHNQTTCSEECRIKKLQMYRTKQSKSDFQNNLLEERLQRVAKYDKALSEWMRKNPIKTLPNGDISIYTINTHEAP